MERVYHNYEKWEDYQNGMYDNISLSNEATEEKVKQAISLLTNSSFFAELSIEMTSKWIVSASENLTNLSCNREAWIGQATCCYVYNISETITKMSWKRLTDNQRNEANLIAKKTIDKYEKENRKLHRSMGESLLF